MKSAATALIALLVATGVNGQVSKPRRLLDLPVPRPVISPESDAVLIPSSITANASSVVLFDYGDHALKQFDLRTGALRFKTGRAGGGPEEFANPTSVQFDAAQRIWVNDPEQPRVSVYTSVGESVRSFRPATPFEKLVLDGSGFVGIGFYGGSFAAVFDSVGHHVRDIAAPAWITALDPLARSYTAATSTDAWAVGLDFTGRILVKSAGDPKLDELPVIETRLPLKDTVFSLQGGSMTVRKPNPKAVRTLRSLSIFGGRLYVLARGAEKKTAFRYVDVYDLKLRSYIYSYMLARPASSIAVNASGIVVLEEIEDMPAISFYAFPVTAPTRIP